MTVPGLSFVAIDFETANRSRGSAVAVGLVRIVAGQITAEFEELIQPVTRRFAYQNVHGIRPEDVEKSEPFALVWDRLRHWLEGAWFVAAHNAEFDRDVLMTCCELAKLPSPRQPFVCTVALARAVWNIRPTRLPDVCAKLGIELRHHEPASDALACARIVLAAWKTELGRRKLDRFAPFG